jgi:methionine synthase II (cobalamin-independent)
MAIAKAINEDILEVDSLGIDFIQLDEFTWPYFFEDWAIEAFNAAIEGGHKFVQSASTFPR